MDDPVCSSCEEVPGSAGSLSCGCSFCHDCFQRYVDGTADELNRSLRCCVCGSITLLTYESKRFVGGQSVSSLCPHFSKSSSTRDPRFGLASSHASPTLTLQSTSGLNEVRVRASASPTSRFSTQATGGLSEPASRTKLEDSHL